MVLLRTGSHNCLLGLPEFRLWPLPLSNHVPPPLRCDIHLHHTVSVLCLKGQAIGWGPLDEFEVFQDRPSLVSSVISGNYSQLLYVMCCTGRVNAIVHRNNLWHSSILRSHMKIWHSSILHSHMKSYKGSGTILKQFLSLEDSYCNPTVLSSQSTLHSLGDVLFSVSGNTLSSDCMGFILHFSTWCLFSAARLQVTAKLVARHNASASAQLSTCPGSGLTEFHCLGNHNPKSNPEPA